MERERERGEEVFEFFSRFEKKNKQKTNSRAAVSFRDASLFPIFSAGLDELRRLGTGASDDGGAPLLSTSPSTSALLAGAGGSGGNLKDNSDGNGGSSGDGGPDAKLREAALSLVLACLSFDFVGTCFDESADDLGTIQVPTPWRAAVEPPETPLLFFQLYASCPRPPLSSLSLECLVRLASVRRSLFGTDAARARFLGALVSGSAALLRARAGLEQHPNYHELCRLLCRLKTNYQLSELVAAEGYAEWIALVADFTVSSLRAWAWAQGSVFYLLGLWSRLVTSVPYLKGDAPCRLDAHVPQIVAAYVHSRLDAARAAAAADGGDADPIAGGDGEEGVGEGRGGVVAAEGGAMTATSSTAARPKPSRSSSTRCRTWLDSTTGALRNCSPPPSTRWRRRRRQQRLRPPRRRPPDADAAGARRGRGGRGPARVAGAHHRRRRPRQADRVRFFRFLRGVGGDRRGPSGEGFRARRGAGRAAASSGGG